jgi:hypothetical protein
MAAKILRHRVKVDEGLPPPDPAAMRKGSLGIVEPRQGACALKYDCRHEVSQQCCLAGTWRAIDAEDAGRSCQLSECDVYGGLLEENE